MFTDQCFGQDVDWLLGARWVKVMLETLQCVGEEWGQMSNHEAKRCAKKEERRDGMDEGCC